MTSSFLFPRTLTAVNAEDTAAALNTLNPNAGEVLLDLSPLVKVDAVAAARIGGALRSLAEGHAITAVLPKQLQAARIDALTDSDDRDVEAVVRSGLLHFLVAHCSALQLGDVDVRHILDETIGTRALHGKTYYLLPQLHAGAIVNVNDFDQFAADFRRWEERLPRPFAENSPEDFQALAQLCFEAIQNVYDHAGKSPLAPDSIISSFFSLAFHQTLPKNPGEHISGYLRRYAKDSNRSVISFIEILVVDNGPGIPARQAGSFDIYAGSVQDEANRLDEALRTGGSIKLRALDSKIRGDPGYGYTKIDDSIANLHGWASLRSGRLRLVSDSTRSPPSRGLTGFRKVNDKFGFEYGLMLGTILQVIIPLAPSRQATLSLK